MMIITELAPIDACPMCQGTGEDYNLKHSRLTKCELCNGRGWIPTVVCMACGKPAYQFWPRHQYPLVQYCGLEDCFNKLVHLHIPKKADKKAEPTRVELEQLKKDIMMRHNEDERNKVLRIFGPCARA